MSIPGIDLSDFQDVDLAGWSSLAIQGIKFALIKATEGRTFQAHSFQDKWQHSKSAGILRGAYHFFRPSRTGEEQATNFLNTLNEVEGLGPDDIAPVLDIEVRDGISSPEIRRRCLVWLEKVEQATGRKPIIYTGSSFGNDVLGSEPKFADYFLWVANYTQGKPWVPGGWTNCAIWQYTDAGKVKGISGNGNVDLNWFNGPESALRAFATGDGTQINSDSLFSDLIHRGDEGDAVKDIQQKLIAQGFPLGPLGADGDFGAFTEAAVRGFQRANNLPINGIVDPATLNKL
jgi:lysozyme